MLTHSRTPLVLKAEVKFSIPGISTKSSDSEASLKTLTLTSRVGQKLPSTYTKNKEERKGFALEHRLTKLLRGG